MENENYTLNQLIIDTTRETNIIKKLNASLFIVRRFEGSDTYTKLNLKEIENILTTHMNDEKFMRVLYYRQALLESPEAYMYFGSDKGEQDPYLFLGRLEKEITIVNDKVIRCMAAIYNELFDEEMSFS